MRFALFATLTYASHALPRGTPNVLSGNVDNVSFFKVGAGNEAEDCECSWATSQAACNNGANDGSACWGACCAAYVTGCDCNWAAEDLCAASAADGSRCWSSCCTLFNRSLVAPKKEQPVDDDSRCNASDWCGHFATWVDRDPDGKFVHLWGETGWEKRNRGDPGCWESLGGSKFFDEALAGQDCERNWLAGAYGNETDRPYAEQAPALFGFDWTIWEYCSVQAGHTDLSDFTHEELARRCVRSQNNILRLFKGKWNMCQNFKWEMCAVNGKLPGQDGRAFRFATPPKELTLSEWQHPTSWPCQGESCPQGRYAVGDVYFAEVAILRKICRNANQLFKVTTGERMVCDVDEDAYHRLAARLMASP